MENVTGKVTNNISRLIQCRGNSITEDIVNIWCPDKYVFDEGSGHCIIFSDPCVGDCPYVQNITHSGNISKYLTNQTLWDEFTREFFNKTKLDGNLSCYQVNPTTSKRYRSCAAMSLWPTEVYSFEDITIFYNGSSVPYSIDIPNTPISGIHPPPPWFICGLNCSMW